MSYTCEAHPSSSRLGNHTKKQCVEFLLKDLEGVSSDSFIQMTEEGVAIERVQHICQELKSVTESNI